MFYFKSDLLLFVCKHMHKKKVFVWTSVQDIIIQQQKDKTKRQQLQKYSVFKDTLPINN